MKKFVLLNSIISMLCLLCPDQLLHAEYTHYFTAADNIHVMVYHTPSSTEIHFLEKLTSPNGRETTLINGAGPMASTEMQVDAGGAVKGEWKHHTDRTYTNSAGTVLHNIYDSTFIMTNTIAGTMLFDETLGGSVSDGYELGSIYVNYGITLTLDTATYTNGSVTADAGTVNIDGGNFSSSFGINIDNGASATIGSDAFLSGSRIYLADGSLTVEDNTTIYNCDITIAGGTFNPGNVVNFSDCKFHYKTVADSSYEKFHTPKGTLYLESGSEGSVISGTNYTVQLLQGDVDFSGAENIHLIAGCDVTLDDGLYHSIISIGNSTVSPIIPFTYSVTVSGLNLEHLYVTGATDCEVMNCEINGVYISGGSPYLHDNAFAGDVDVLYGGDNIRLEYNTFHAGLRLAEPYGSRIPGEPTIKNNDFMGPGGITYDYASSTNPLPTAGSIHIGKNYYGSPKGPSTDHMNYNDVLYGMMGDNGAQFSTVHIPDYQQHYDWFDIADFNKTPMATSAKLSDLQPVFWLAGWGTGQGILNWYPSHNSPLMYKCSKAIVAFDIRCSQDGTPADCYLENITAGTTIHPKFKPGSYNRLLSSQHFLAAMQGQYTTIFEVPPPVLHDTVHFKLHLVDSDNNDTIIADNYLYFTNSPWQRNLRIAVVPVQVDYWLSSKPAPSASSMRTVVMQTLPAVFPLPKSKLTVHIQPPATMEVNVGLVTHLPALETMAVSLAHKYVDGGKNPYDIVIAVMPEGTINAGGDITGLFNISPPAAGLNVDLGTYFWNSSDRVLIVDSSQPMAFLHEMGHAAGLYRSTEQYDMPEYVKSEGMPLSTFSAAALSTPPMSGYPGTGIVNFAPPKVNWYHKGYRWIDVMGLTEDHTWTDTQTHGSILSFLTNICTVSSSSAPSSLSYGDSTTSTAATDNTRLPLDYAGNNSIPLSYTSGTYIVVGGPSLRIGDTIGQYPIPDAWIFDAAGFETVPDAPATNGVNWYQHAIMRFWNGGSLITNRLFDLPDTQLDCAWWSYSFSLPSNCNKVQLLWEKNGETMVGEWTPAGTLSVDIDETELANPMSKISDLEWSVTASSPATNSHIYSQVAYSTNNGTTWIDWDDPTTGHYREFNNEFLPVSSTVALRVTVSDGFSMAQDAVYGLQVVDRMPSVTVVSPRSNDVTLTGSDWPLIASASDVEDGVLPVSWTSSRDGVITTNTVLSKGFHILTASATDSYGNSKSVTIPVYVVDTASDIDLTIDSFKKAGTFLDYQKNWLLREKGIHKGETNFIECIVRNSGITVTGRLDVTICPPSGTNYIWTTNNIAFEKFALHRILVPVIPQEYGTYHLSAKVSPFGFSDRNPRDNYATCTTYTESPVLMLEQNGYQRSEVLTISAEWSEAIGFYNKDIYIHNGGSADLIITNIHVVSSYQHITANTGTTLPIVLAPDERQTVTLRYYDDTVGRRDATLHIDSNDPVRPHLDAPLYCWDYDYNDPATREPSLDPDNDRLPNYVEELIGTSTNNPDTDGDGIIDGYEDYNGNGILDPRETSPLNPDTDGDGLLDGEEDSNHNGGMDGEETSPIYADTDGDQLTDYEETITRTRAVDPDSVLIAGNITHNAGETVITWSAKRDVHYRIEQSTDLTQWTVAPSGTGDDYQADRTAARDATLTYRCADNNTKTFYRINAIK